MSYQGLREYTIFHEALFLIKKNLKYEVFTNKNINLKSKQNLFTHYTVTTLYIHGHDSQMILFLSIPILFFPSWIVWLKPDLPYSIISKLAHETS